MSTFPLPLNAVEHYMLADDSVGYPRCFFLVVRYGGRLDEARLRKAIDTATRRHPLLRALVEYRGERPRKWTECFDPCYEIVWYDGPGDERIVAPIDLEYEPGVRFRVRQESAGDALTIEFHHACCDGLGAIQFLDDLVTSYQAVLEPTQWSLPPLDPQRLKTRDAFGLTGWRRPLRWVYGTFGWLGSIEYFAHRPAPLGELPAYDLSLESRASGYCAQALSAEQTRAIIESAKSDGVTVNDRMMRDLFLALQEFTENNWPDRATAHKRIMVPTNLRSADDTQLPAANVVAMINLDRRPQRWKDSRRMLRVLHLELSAVKRLRLGVIFVQLLHTLQLLFRSLKPFLPTDRCQATCVASNLGPVLPKIADDVVRSVEFYPPIRPLTAAAFGIATYGGRMTIALHFDRAVMTANQGRKLLDCFVAKLHESCDEVRCAASGR